MNDIRNDDEHIHALFAQVAADPAPPLGFTADGIADLGRRGARARRIAAVSSATAGIAAVGIAVATLPGTGGSGRVAAGSTPTSSALAGSTTVRPDPICVADVAKAFQGMPDPLSEKLALQECPAMRAIGKVFAPQGRHFTETNSAGRAITPDIVWGETGYQDMVTGTSAGLCYTEDGRAPVPNQERCAGTPAVLFGIDFSLPGAPDPSPQTGDMSLANRKPGVADGFANWNQKSSTTLKDGSTVTVSEVQNGDRVAMKARRVLTSGAALTITAIDAYDSTSAVEQPGSVYNPFPFTLDQMAAAVSVEQFVSPSALKEMPPLPGVPVGSSASSHPSSSHG
jgi:hypothetical protein